MTAPGNDSPCPDAFVHLAEQLADTAGAIIARAFRRSFAVERKADSSPVTEVDRETEAAMRRLITEAFPDHGIIGEEYGPEREEAETLWVLDPIDGTKRFASGHVQFGTLITLLREGRPILGVIDMPELGERWLGAVGRPTVHRDRRGRREARTRACPDLAEAVLYTTSPEMFVGADRPAFARVSEAAAMTLYGGECYAYGLLASGFADLTIEADMAPYDYLAHVPVVEGAGGLVTDWAGRPLGLDSGERVLAAGDRELHEVVRAVLAVS